MISSYRLGDLFFLDLNEYDINKILDEHPNSIGSKYIIEKKNKNNSLSNIDLITKIILEFSEQIKHLLPICIDTSTVIHLRLGDVIAGSEWHEKMKRPLPVDDLRKKLDGNNTKKYVIGKCFFADTSSKKNIDESIDLSKKYLKVVLNEFDGNHFDSGNPDIDLCCAIKSKLFIQGRGFFSKLIVEVRKKLNLDCIITETYTQREFKHYL